MNNTNAEQGRQRLCLKEGEGESLKSLALVGRTLHICIIIADNLCVHYFNYCNLPSLHIIINGTAFSELNWHQFMRPLGGKEHTHTQCKAFCVSFGRELHSVFTNLNYCARRIMPPSPPVSPSTMAYPLPNLVIMVRIQAMPRGRRRRRRRLYNVLNCATFASCVYYDDDDGNGDGDGDSDSESSPARSCCSDSVHCFNIHARFCHFCLA